MADTQCNLEQLRLFDKVGGGCAGSALCPIGGQHRYCRAVGVPLFERSSGRQPLPTEAGRESVGKAACVGGAGGWGVYRQRYHCNDLTGMKLTDWYNTSDSK
jgi:hypothetical protein